MRVLLDTHAFLWFAAGSQNLSRTARDLIENPETELLLSIASAWEIAIKSSIGKLELPEPIDSYLINRLEVNSTMLLGIDLSHVIRSHALPFHHRDPFDRLIIAQALVEGLSVVTSDTLFADYGVDQKW